LNSWIKNFKTPFQDIHIAHDETKAILSIPHGGELIPEEFNQYLSGNAPAYDQDVDYKTYELVDINKLNRVGITVIIAKVHRICVDLNRTRELAVLNWKSNTQGEILVANEPQDDVKEQMLKTFYDPYYGALTQMVADINGQTKHLVPFVDLHSMPSKPTAYHMKQNPNQKQERPDFCLSDQHGKTCLPEYIKKAQNLLLEQGYNATINDPYIGGNLTVYVGGLATNNIQIEINRALYMDEEKHQLDDYKFSKLKANLTSALTELLQLEPLP